MRTQTERNGQPRRELSEQQQSAVELLAAGKTDKQTAETLSLPVERVTKWRLYDPVFQAALNALGRLCADWPRLDLVKIDADGAVALVWEGMQATLRRFPHAAVVLELHLQRDPPQTVGFLHYLQRSGYSLHSIVAKAQEHWTLWLQK
jgi:hypothetical protein